MLVFHEVKLDVQKFKIIRNQAERILTLEVQAWKVQIKLSITSDHSRSFIELNASNSSDILRALYYRVLLVFAYKGFMFITSHFKYLGES